MKEFHVLLKPACTALEMHQTGQIRRHNIVGASFADKIQLVVTHLGGDGFFSDRKGTAETAAFVPDVRNQQTQYPLRSAVKTSASKISGRGHARSLIA